MNTKIKVLVLASILSSLFGCHSIRYPAIGASSKYTVRPTNWRGQTCILTLDLDTGKKIYVCGPDRYRR
jgi:hypothetical protein